MAGSWIITNLKNGAVWESFSAVNVERARKHPDVFKVEPVLEYLARVNAEIKRQDLAENHLYVE